MVDGTPKDLLSFRWVIGTGLCWGTDGFVIGQGCGSHRRRGCNGFGGCCTSLGVASPCLACLDPISGEEFVEGHLIELNDQLMDEPTRCRSPCVTASLENASVTPTMVDIS